MIHNLLKLKKLFNKKYQNLIRIKSLRLFNLHNKINNFKIIKILNLTGKNLKLYYLYKILRLIKIKEKNYLINLMQMETVYYRQLKSIKVYKIQDHNFNQFIRLKMLCFKHLIHQNNITSQKINMELITQRSKNLEYS